MIYRIFSGSLLSCTLFIYAMAPREHLNIKNAAMNIIEQTWPLRKEVKRYKFGEIKKQLKEILRLCNCAYANTNEQVGLINLTEAQELLENTQRAFEVLKKSYHQ